MTTHRQLVLACLVIISACLTCGRAAQEVLDGRSAVQAEIVEKNEEFVNGGTEHLGSEADDEDEWSEEDRKIYEAADGKAEWAPAGATDPVVFQPPKLDVEVAPKPAAAKETKGKDSQQNKMCLECNYLIILM